MTGVLMSFQLLLVGLPGQTQPVSGFHDSVGLPVFQDFFQKLVGSLFLPAGFPAGDGPVFLIVDIDFQDSTVVRGQPDPCAGKQIIQFLQPGL
jgi:hypothetical protein